MIKNLCHLANEKTQYYVILNCGSGGNKRAEGKAGVEYGLNK